MNLAWHIRVLLGVSLCGWNGVQADDLGRLFTTPADRARIDVVRAGGTAVIEAGEPVTTVNRDYMTLDGTLIGSDGKRLVWLNGTRVEPDGSDRPMRLMKDGQVRMDWRDGTRTLKPGQMLDWSTGEVIERYTRSENTAPVPAIGDLSTPPDPDPGPSP
ncbi:MAG: hypothetical protein OQK27_05255 [Gammaproteobacteria bacterium]|nr:hypothetical protein [Gammaproteobacteria bacterium]